MLTILTIKLLSQLITRLQSIRTKFLLKNGSERIFPLSKSDEVTLAKHSIYFRRFQAAVSSIHGMITNDEAALLFSIACSQDIDGEILEIGSWLGKSTVHLAMGAKISKNGKVTAVDTFIGNAGKENMYTAPLKNSETIIERFRKNIALAGVSKNVDVFHMSSVEAARRYKKPIRLLFIDGCHDYEAAIEDIKIWTPKVMHGGIIILDDFTHQFPGVVQAAQELLFEQPNKFKVLFQYDSLLIAKKI